jgi:hypothetical protein
MSDRIAREAVERLRKIALLQSLFATGPDRSEIEAHAADLRAVLADRERLRGLIVAAGADESPWAVGSHRPWNMNRDPWCCAWCAVYWDGHGEQPEHSPDCPWPALEAEARAIREERGEKLCTCLPSHEGFDGTCRNCREEQGRG